MTETSHLSRGQQGEEITCYFLQKKGYKILERNFTNTEGVRQGEIDIIALYKGKIIFVEVKTRKQSSQDEILLPEVSITPAKLRKMLKISEYYLRKTKRWKQEYRYDAVTVCLNEESGKAKVRHLESIFF